MNLAFRIKRLKIINEYYDDFKKTPEKMPAGRAGMWIRTIGSMVLWGTSFSEYFVYRFWTKSFKEKKTYLTRRHMVGFFDKYNPKELRDRIGDKSQATKYYADFLKRDQFKYADGEEAFRTFCRKYPQIFLKKAVGWGGDGARAEDVSTNEKIDAVWKSLTSDYIAEPLITNCKEIREFAPNSLNTLRVTILMVKGEPVVQYVWFRLGNGDQTDNLHSGGVASGVDLKTGCVATKAFDRHFMKYTVHPGSGKQIYGFKIPYFDEAVQLAKDAAMVTPGLRYVSWDVAVTENGPMIMEGNWDAETYIEQMIFERGNKDLYIEQLEKK